MLSRWLPLEAPLVELEEQIDELKRLAASENLDLSAQLGKLEAHKVDVMGKIFSDLSPWEKVQMARHPKRPYSLDYIGSLFTDWMELHGDRAYGDDGAVVAGFARLNGRSVAIVGNQKGRDTKERQARNFGQPSPEGLRKAGRVMEMAARFGRPIISLVDTPGAACSPAAEERGISEAIAASQMLMSQLQVPIIVVIIGEGCSGGAIATALGDRVLMLEHAYYSVISPEGCSAILFRDAAKAPLAAEQLKITAGDALRLKVIEEIVPEPLGGAHRNLKAMNVNLGATLEKHLDELQKLSGEELVEQRYQRFRKLGDLEDPQQVAKFLPELNGAPALNGAAHS
ncbi:acetyl-CoA carboxylase carboxyl transferase subunit alpha [Abditibacterium utsteinense]|uniref:Acetyl-coenzyme A carboxylase carboxyl transferase subunit alpha n=1 Tax=Abditibacterium utsteinense TaxID=1960156 RepID=A0A2S8SWE9_9BACT|nr:acetyl-CoA carboxylase carboxyltransferase subunit alpha [Abditibacterium utsteinense]PQV65120.1 acetyl-CoA carboxylase carboxyl transferase subunit alpha [Abditibacterium utsteinense]